MVNLWVLGASRKLRPGSASRDSLLITLTWHCLNVQTRRRQGEKRKDPSIKQPALECNEPKRRSAELALY
jgi:hypothetical protein